MKVREVHLQTRNDNYYVYRNCVITIDNKFVVIKEGNVDNIFPLDAVELISSLKEGEMNEKDNDRAT